MIGHFLIKILIKFIDNTENFCIFGFGYYNYICHLLFIITYKYVQTSHGSQLFEGLFTTFLIPNSSIAIFLKYIYEEENRYLETVTKRILVTEEALKRFIKE